MRPIFVIDEEDQQDGNMQVGVSYVEDSISTIEEALYRSSKENRVLSGIVERVYARLNRSVVMGRESTFSKFN